MVLPVSTSPLSIASTPSRRSASANFLSVLTRPCTNSLKLFVFAIFRLRSISCTLAALVVLPAGMCRIDVALLPLLGSADQQDDDRLAVAPEINPIAGTKIDPILQHAFPTPLMMENCPALYGPARERSWRWLLRQVPRTAKGALPLAAT